MILIINLFVTF